MAKFKPCNYDQMVMLPICLEKQLVPGSLEHTINELVEKKIELSVFDARYSNDDTGASAIHPKVLLKVILFAYARGLISSRQIELACRDGAGLRVHRRPQHHRGLYFFDASGSGERVLQCVAGVRATWAAGGQSL